MAHHNPSLNEWSHFKIIACIVNNRLAIGNNSIQFPNLRSTKTVNSIFRRRKPYFSRCCLRSRITQERGGVGGTAPFCFAFARIESHRKIARKVYDIGGFWIPAESIKGFTFRARIGWWITDWDNLEGNSQGQWGEENLICELRFFPPLVFFRERRGKFWSEKALVKLKFEGFGLGGIGKPSNTEAVRKKIVIGIVRCSCALMSYWFLCWIVI